MHYSSIGQIIKSLCVSVSQSVRVCRTKRVEFADPTWIGNPHCCIQVSHGQGRVPPSSSPTATVNIDSRGDADDEGQCNGVHNITDESILGISIVPWEFHGNPVGMGTTKLISWECECLDGNGRE